MSVYRKLRLYSQVFVLVAAGVMVSVQMHRRLLLNLGILAGIKVILADASPEKAAHLLEQVQPESSLSHSFLLGNAYWESGYRDKGRRTWGDLGIVGRRVLIAWHHFVLVGDEARAADWRDKAETLGCRASIRFQLGDDAQAQGDFRAALEYYQQATTFPVTPCDPYGHSDALYRMGIILHRHTSPPEWDRAFDLYQQALLLDDFHGLGNKSDAHFRLGQIYYYIRRDLDQAIEAMRQAVAVNPNHAWAYKGLGSYIYKRDGDFETARGYILRAISLDRKNPYFYVGLGDLYRSAGLVDDAIAYYHQALALSPENRDANNRLQALENTP